MTTISKWGPHREVDPRLITPILTPLIPDYDTKTRLKTDIDRIRSANKFSTFHTLNIKNVVNLFKLPFLDTNVEKHLCQVFE